MTDRSHLDALELRLSHERERLRKATDAGEIELRTVWVNQIIAEIDHEAAFIGLVDEHTPMTDDELLAALKA